MKRFGVVLSAVIVGTSGGYGQNPNCTRTMRESLDAHYSAKSMSYHWSNGNAPSWLEGAVAEWNSCRDSPFLSVGADGTSLWRIVHESGYNTNLDPELNGRGLCGFTDDSGIFGPAGTIYVFTDREECTDPVETVSLHEMGHSLGVDHDGPGCPVSIMTADTSVSAPHGVSSYNCAAVRKFKREWTGRNRGGGGGDTLRGDRLDRGDDPISVCTENPDLCITEEEEMTCKHVYDSPSSNVLNVTLVCSY